MASCAHCGYNNKAGTAFCTECGRSLSVRGDDIFADLNEKFGLAAIKDLGAGRGDDDLLNYSFGLEMDKTEAASAVIANSFGDIKSSLDFSNLTDALRDDNKLRSALTAEPALDGGDIAPAVDLNSALASGAALSIPSASDAAPLARAAGKLQAELKEDASSIGASIDRVNSGLQTANSGIQTAADGVWNVKRAADKVRSGGVKQVSAQLAAAGAGAAMAVYGIKQAAAGAKQTAQGARLTGYKLRDAAQDIGNAAHAADLDRPLSMDDMQEIMSVMRSCMAASAPLQAPLQTTMEQLRMALKLCGRVMPQDMRVTAMAYADTSADLLQELNSLRRQAQTYLKLAQRIGAGDPVPNNTPRTVADWRSRIELLQSETQKYSQQINEIIEWWNEHADAIGEMQQSVSGLSGNAAASAVGALDAAEDISSINSHIIFSIFNLIFCPILGIFALIASIGAGICKISNNYDKAKKCSDSALMINIWGIFIGAIFWAVMLRE